MVRGATRTSARNALVVVQGHDHPRLYRQDVDAIDMHWIAGAPPALPRRLGAKTRYRMADARCASSSRATSGVVARFDVPQWAPTPGQYLVLYDGDVCLGGGVITDSGRCPPAAQAPFLWPRPYDKALTRQASGSCDPNAVGAPGATIAYPRPSSSARSATSRP